MYQPYYKLPVYQHATYSTEHVIPGYPIHRPASMIQPATPTMDYSNTILSQQSNQLVSDIQATLKTDCVQEAPSLPPSLMDMSRIQATDTSVPLTVNISVLSLRFMLLGSRFKTPVAELEQMYRQQAAELESQRYRALCTGMSNVSVSVYYDQQHQNLINRIQNSLQLLEEKQKLQNSRKSHKSTTNSTTTVPQPACTADIGPKADYRKHNNFQSLNAVAVRILSSWYERNKSHPYPSYETCEGMGKASNVTVEQVKKWFANRRMRERNTKPLKQIAARRKRVRTESETETPESKMIKPEMETPEFNKMKPEMSVDASCMFTGLRRV